MNATIKLFIALFVMFFYEFVCNFVEYIYGNAYFFIGTSIVLAGWINADNDIPYYYIVKEENDGKDQIIHQEQILHQEDPVVVESP